MFGWLYTNRIFMAILVVVSLMSVFAMIYKIVQICKETKKEHVK